MELPPRLVVVALGTRGDVQPLALIAIGLKERFGYNVDFATHVSLLQGPLGPYLKNHHVLCHGVDLPAAAPAAADPAARGSFGGAEQWDRTLAALRPLLGAAEDARLLLLFNLFALECEPGRCSAGFPRRASDSIAAPPHKACTSRRLSGAPGQPAHTPT